MKSFPLNKVKAYRISKLALSGEVESVGDIVPANFDVCIEARNDFDGVIGAALTATFEPLQSELKGPCALELWMNNDRGDLLLWVFPLVENGELYENTKFGRGNCPKWPEFPCDRIFQFIPVRRVSNP